MSETILLVIFLSAWPDETVSSHILYSRTIDKISRHQIACAITKEFHQVALFKTDGIAPRLRVDALTDGMRRPVSDGMLYAPKLSTCFKHKR